MKLDYRRTFWVGFAFTSITAFWQLYDAIIPLILKNTFEIDGVFVGGVMALDNVLALFLLPFFGALSDRTQTRLGKRTPFILCGTAAAVTFTALLPVADNSRNLPLFVVALGLVLLSMASYRSPAVALMPDVTPKPLRSKGNAVINLMGTLGGILSLLAINFLVPPVEKPNYAPLFHCVMAFMVLAVCVLLLKVRENALCEKARQEALAMDGDEPEAPENVGVKLPPQVRRSLLFILASVFLLFMGYNAVSTWFSTYATAYWGMTGGSFSIPLTVAQGAAVLAYIPVGMAASVLGRRRVIMLGAGLLAASFGCCAFFTQFTPLVYVFFTLAGVGYAAVIVNIFPMVWEMCKQADVGKYTGYYYTMSMSAQILTPILSSALISAGHSLFSALGPDAGYALLFPYAAAFELLCLAAMSQVRHGDSKPVGQKPGLEAFDVDA